MQWVLSHCIVEGVLCKEVKHGGDQWFSALQDMILYIALSEVLWAISALVKCCMCSINGFDELFANVKPSIGYSDCDSLD